MKILIIGANGRLGRVLTDRLAGAHDIIAADIHSDAAHTLDITDYHAVHEALRLLRPQLVIHTAAWTDVDACAREPERALLINGIGAQNVAVAAAQTDATMCYISTNEVFDGAGQSPYKEYDATHPINPYAYSKWFGERAIVEVLPRHYIVRTAWLFAHGGKNFIQAILNATKQGKTLRVVTDEIANPTYNDDLAEAIVQLVQTERYGTYHLVNEGAASRYAFARHALDVAGLRDVPIEPITLADWQRASTPPPHAPLANHVAASIGIRLRDWHEAVEAFLAREGLLAL